MKAAMDRGLLVAKPFGDSAGYDVIVDTSRPYQTPGPRGRLLRVQVKCVVTDRAATRNGVLRRN